MPFLMSFALEREIVTLAWIDYVSVQFPLNIYATKGFIAVSSRPKSAALQGDSASSSSFPAFLPVACSRRVTITEKTIEVRMIEATTASEIVVGMSTSHAPRSIFTPMTQSTSDRPTLR